MFFVQRHGLYNIQMIKAIIFDLDGTLLNTAPDIQFVLNDSLAHFNLPPVPIEKLYGMLGDGAYNLVDRAVPEDRKELVQRVYEYYVPAYANYGNFLTCLYEGEDEALMRLKNAGIKLCVLSNKPQLSTQNVCAQKLGKYNFDVILGQGQFPLKPDPAAALHIMETLGVKREECLFVGDGEADCLTAKNAGIACVSVLWGFRTREQLEGYGACLFAGNYAQFLQILQEKFSLSA